MHSPETSADAFASSTLNPLMNLFAHLASWMKPGGILTTYCAKGGVRRAMLAAGPAVERQGPPQARNAAGTEARLMSAKEK